MIQQAEDSKYNPPGGILLWIIIGMELLTFFVGIIFFYVEKSADPGLFRLMQARLDITFGTINTILLITGGYTAAIAILKLRRGNSLISGRYTLTSFFFGIAFLGLKSFEYHNKLEAGFDMGYNTFFTFYWLLTVFHFIHVAVGVSLLLFMFIKIQKGEYSDTNMENPESIAMFWHMCDLIWIILFPVLYLIP